MSEEKENKNCPMEKLFDALYENNINTVFEDMLYEKIQILILLVFLVDDKEGIQ